MSSISGAQLNLQILHAVNIMHIKGTVKSTILLAVNVMHFRGTVKSTNIACWQCHAFQGHS